LRNQIDIHQLCHSQINLQIQLTKPAAQRLALLASAGLGGQSHQTPNPPLGQNPRKCGQSPHLSSARNVGQILQGDFELAFALMLDSFYGILSIVCIFSPFI
jgi:hypothetical protein